MDFDLSEEQRTLRDAASGFARRFPQRDRAPKTERDRRPEADDRAAE